MSIYKSILLLLTFHRQNTASRAENLVDRSLGYQHKENVIIWNLNNMWGSCTSSHNIVHESVHDCSLHKENVVIWNLKNALTCADLVTRLQWECTRLRCSLLTSAIQHSAGMFYSHTSALNDIIKCMGAMSLMCQCIHTALSINYNVSLFLSLKMLSDSISEHLNFSVMACPQFPLEQHASVDILLLSPPKELLIPTLECCSLLLSYAQLL